ncbi:MAG TPA: PEGA domain-containing protein [Polyangia bacterium]|jgi:PEGA domain.|nr:PEGA domain-containing protein [Polyangia bacterium]
MLTLVRLCTLFCLSTVLVPAARAQAQASGTQRVAVVRLEFEGKIPKVLQQLFARRLLEGLSAVHFEVLSDNDVQNKLVGPQLALASCRDASCFPAMASALSASYLIGAKVSESNKTYVVTMDIINGRTGAVLGSNRERCETCGVEEAGEKMGLAASALRERLETVARAPARFVVRSRPASASVEIDGRIVGVTPLDVELAGGVHHLRLLMRGYDPLERTLTAVGGVDEGMDLDLVAIPSHFPHRTVGLATLAGGVVLLVSGIITMTFDREEIGCSAREKDPYGHCPWVRSTKWWGAAMVGTGAAAATLGGVFLYLAPRGGSTTLGVGLTRTF